jgi:hypothetical protein
MFLFFFRLFEVQYLYNFVTKLKLKKVKVAYIFLVAIQINKKPVSRATVSLIAKVIPYHVERLEFGSELDGSADFFQMFWPVVLSHKVR